MIGRTIGGYQVLEQIGMGGMATVYRAYDASTDRYVALKTLPQQYSKDPHFVERFRREARAIAKLEHLHILPLFAYGEEDGITYLVMRYLPAGTLSERIRQMGQMPLEEAARLLGQVASALDHAHANNILHRDIKPSNILIDQGGNAYLTDFGIARMVEGTLDLTGDAVLGTPQYMSPEQCEGRKDLSAASDLYSLGVVLYEMVTGRTPFQAETPLAVIHMQMMGAAMPPPGSLREDLPEAAERVILKALAREPNNRYPSCAALTKAFADAIKEPARTQPAIHSAVPDVATIRASTPAPVSDSPTTRLPKPSTEARSGLSTGMIAAGIGLGLVIVAGILLLLNRPVPPSVADLSTAAGTATLAPMVTEASSSAESTAESTTPAFSGPASDLVTQGDAFIANYEYDKALEAYNSALTAVPDDPAILLKRAEALKGAGDLPAAIADYQQITQLDPSRADVFSLIGDTYQSLGQYDKAIENYSKAADAGSTDSHVFAERGNLYSARADGEKAIADLDKAIKLDPKFAFAYVYRGNEYTRQGDYDSALADFTQAIRLDKNEVWAYRGRANVFQLQGDLNGAIEDLNKAIDLTPEDSGLLLLRGQVYSQYGDSDSALKDFDRAIDLSSDYAEAYIARGQAYHNRNELEPALTDYNKAIELQPDNADLYAARGLIYRDMSEYNNALVDYTQAIKLSPNNAQFYADRAVVYGWKSDRDKVFADLDKAIQLQPDFVAAYIQRAFYHVYNNNEYEAALADFHHARALDETSLYSYRGPVETLLQALLYTGQTIPGYDLDNALEDANRAVELRPDDDSDIYFERAQIYAYRNEPDKAIADLTTAISIYNGDDSLFILRGKQYTALGDYNKAIADLTEAIRLNPDGSEAYSARGAVYQSTGKYEQALADWDQALKGDISNVTALEGRISTRLEMIDAGLLTEDDDLLKKMLEYADVAAQYASPYPNVYVLRAQIYSRMGQHDLAIADNNQAIVIDSQMVDAYIQRGLEYHALKNDEAALADLQQAITLEPTSAWAYEALGLVYYESGQTAEALDAYQHYVSLVGEDKLTDEIRQRIAELEAQPTATAS